MKMPLTIADFKHLYLHLTIPPISLLHWFHAAHTPHTHIYTPVVLQVRQHLYLQYWTCSTVFEDVLRLTIPGENTQTR